MTTEKKEKTEIGVISISRRRIPSDAMPGPKRDVDGSQGAGWGRWEVTEAVGVPRKRSEGGDRQVGMRDRDGMAATSHSEGGWMTASSWWRALWVANRHWKTKPSKKDTLCGSEPWAWPSGPCTTTQTHGVGRGCRYNVCIEKRSAFILNKEEMWY